MAQQWFYLEGQEQKGPLTWQELYVQASSGNLHPEQWVWAEGLAEWTPGRDVQGLFATPPPLPMPPSQTRPPPPPASPVPLQTSDASPPAAPVYGQAPPFPKTFVGPLLKGFWSLHNPDAAWSNYVCQGEETSGPLIAPAPAPKRPSSLKRLLLAVVALCLLVAAVYLGVVSEDKGAEMIVATVMFVVSMTILAYLYHQKKMSRVWSGAVIKVTEDRGGNWIHFRTDKGKRIKEYMSYNQFRGCYPQGVVVGDRVIKQQGA